MLVRAKKVSFKGVNSDKIIYLGDGISEIVNFTDCVCEKVVIRGEQVAFNSGTYASIRGIGMGTKIFLNKHPLELVKKYNSFNGKTPNFLINKGLVVNID